MSEPMDLGHGHTLTFVQWAPDRKLNPQHDGTPDEPRFGANVSHLDGNGQECEGFVTFDGPIQQKVSPSVPKWTVESWEPLTLSPSLLCQCGDHGHIRDGKWIPA
jgi:hypothetical protein